MKCQKFPIVSDMKYVSHFINAPTEGRERKSSVSHHDCYPKIATGAVFTTMWLCLCSNTSSDLVEISFILVVTGSHTTL